MRLEEEIRGGKPVKFVILRSGDGVWVNEHSNGWDLLGYSKATGDIVLDTTNDRGEAGRFQEMAQHLNKLVPYPDQFPRRIELGERLWRNVAFHQHQFTEVRPTYLSHSDSGHSR